MESSLAMQLKNFINTTITVLQEEVQNNEIVNVEPIKTIAAAAAAAK